MYTGTIKLSFYMSFSALHSCTTVLAVRAREVPAKALTVIVDVAEGLVMPEMKAAMDQEIAAFQ
jgi:hypothetical protein